MLDKTLGTSLEYHLSIYRRGILRYLFRFQCIQSRWRTCVVQIHCIFSCE